MVIAICMLAGVMVGIFVVIPLLVPFLLAAGVAAFLLYRYKRGKRG
ncbi:MAG: hypothetical protein FWH01_14160 [Oscillospiraceae bacterium]|nr:hypothetical protein [Oscillospiraceae bacterium]